MPASWHIECHYTTCDICGNGYDTIRVDFPRRSESESGFACVRTSRCHGDDSRRIIEKEDVKAWLKEQEFLLATRSAISRYKALLRELDAWTPRRVRTERAEVHAVPAEEFRPAGTDLGAAPGVDSAADGDVPGDDQHVVNGQGDLHAGGNPALSMDTMVSAVEQARSQMSTFTQAMMGVTLAEWQEALLDDARRRAAAEEQMSLYLHPGEDARTWAERMMAR